MMEPIVDEPSTHCTLQSQAQQLRNVTEQLVPKHELGAITGHLDGGMEQTELGIDSPTGGSGDGNYFYL